MAGGPLSNRWEHIPVCRALVDVSIKVASRAFSGGYEIEGECRVDPAIAARETD